MGPRVAEPRGAIPWTSPKAEARREALDIHDTTSKIERATARLNSNESGISQAEVAAILEFAEARRLAVSPLRSLAYLEKLRQLAVVLGEQLVTPTRETPGRFLRAYRDSEVWTQLTMRSVLYSFWKWRLEREEKELPPWLRIPISKRKVNHKDHADVLTPDEIVRLADHAVNLRDKALIWVLYESGGRIGEVLTLRIGDVERTDYGAIRLYFPTGKTGRRTVPLFEAAVPNLLLWLKNHPRRDDKDAPLWCGVQQSGRIGETIGYRMVVKVLRKAADRAGISKPINPHNLRHSRATEIAQNPLVSTSVLENLFGWQPGSPMAKTYVHLSGKEVEAALARAHGIDIGKAQPTNSRRPLVCARCSTSNDPQGKFCVQCGGPLSLGGVEQAEVERVELDQLGQLLEDPSVQRFLARRLAGRLTRPSPNPRAALGDSA